MGQRPSQFFLADLVAVIALTGLVLVLPRSIGRDDPPIGVFLLIGLVVVVWRTFRVMRALPVCDTCGRRFHSPPAKPTPAVCPQCGHLQQGADRRRQRLAVASWAVLALVLLVGLLIRSLPIEFAGSPVTFLPWIALLIALPLVTLLLLVLFLVLLSATSASLGTKQASPPCENCGVFNSPSAVHTALDLPALPSRASADDSVTEGANQDRP